MNTEQQIVDLIKEGKVADAMQLIKDNLTEQAGQSIVDTKFDIAEGYGMKKKMKEGDYKDKEEMSEEEDEEDMEDDDDKEEMDDEDDDMDEMKDKKKNMGKKK